MHAKGLLVLSLLSISFCSAAQTTETPDTRSGIYSLQAVIAPVPLIMGAHVKGEALFAAKKQFFAPLHFTG